MEGIISVAFVYGIILTEYYLFMFHFLPGYKEIYGGWAILIGFEFTLLYIILHYAYYQVQFTPPGHTPKDLVKHYHEQTLEDIKQRTKSHSEQINKLRKKRHLKQFELAEEEDEIFDIIQSIQLVSYCFKCNNIKLPRTHHCKECNKCVLRMDHHCPWVNNCIGLRNHRFFCQFIVYALCCMSQCVYFIFIDNFFRDATVLSELTANSQFLCLICAFTCVGLILSMGFLLGFHLYILGQNMTTVEYHIEEMKTDNPFTKPKKLDNLKEIFGYEFKYWFFPIREPNKNELPRSDLFEV